VFLNIYKNILKHFSRLASVLEKLSQDGTVNNSAKKHAANRSDQVTTVRKLKLLPTHKQKALLCSFYAWF